MNLAFSFFFFSKVYLTLLLRADAEESKLNTLESAYEYTTQQKPSFNSLSPRRHVSQVALESISEISYISGRNFFFCLNSCVRNNICLRKNLRVRNYTIFPFSQSLINMMKSLRSHFSHSHQMLTFQNGLYR